MREFQLSEEKKELYKLPLHHKFDPNLLPAIQNLKALRYKPGQIGMILGYAGKNSRDWIKNLSHNNSEVKNALEIGEEMSKSYLIEQAYKSGVGYEYVEEHDIQKETLNRDGEVVTLHETKKIKKDRPPSSRMIMFLACSKMPDEFFNRMEAGKKGMTINISDKLSADQIKELAGNLAKFADEARPTETQQTND